MKEWLEAKSIDDVRSFYDKKYRENGYDSFRKDDWRKEINLLKSFGGDFSEEKSLIDFACGHGGFLEKVCNDLMCEGVELSKVAYRLALDRLKNKVILWNFSIEEFLEGDDSQFDYITCFGSLEHTADPKKCFQEMFSRLNPGGVLLISMPLETEDCLSHIQAEENSKNNERFATSEEWINYFSEVPIYHEIIGSDIYMIYRDIK